LKNKKQFKNWVLIDHPELKNWFKHVDDKKARKRALFAIMKQIMKEKKNILLEEMSEKTLRKYINYHIKKYNYKIITFQFTVGLKEAHKRDIQRTKAGKHEYFGEKKMQKYHKLHEKRFDKNAIVVDCNKLNKKQVVNYILKNLK